MTTFAGKGCEGEKSKSNDAVFCVHFDHLVLDRLYYWANTVLYTCTCRLWLWLWCGGEGAGQEVKISIGGT